MKKIIKYEIFSILFCIILGTLLHFTYELSNQNAFIGTFSAVNESVWEHLKLTFFPTLITTLLSSFFLEHYKEFIGYRLKGILYSLSFTVIFFYTYSGILGKSILIIDILTFIVSIFVCEYITLKQFFRFQENSNGKLIYNLAIWIIIAILFVIFTFYPLPIGLFTPPVS